MTHCVVRIFVSIVGGDSVVRFLLLLVLFVVVAAAAVVVLGVGGLVDGR